MRTAEELKWPIGLAIAAAKGKAYDNAVAALSELLRLATPPAPTPALLEPLRELLDFVAFTQKADEAGNKAQGERWDSLSAYSYAVRQYRALCIATEAALRATARPTAPAATAEAAWLPLYPACKLPAVGERVALLNNYGRAALLAPRWGHLEQCIEGYVWRIDGDSAAWDFANFTHYLPIPTRPTTEATITRHLQA